MDQVKLLEYIMFTPNEMLPPMPNGLENERHTDLGLEILTLLNEGKITIDYMDSRGLLHISSSQDSH